LFDLFDFRPSGVSDDDEARLMLLLLLLLLLLSCRVLCAATCACMIAH
jgi:hypothetical protein